MDDKFVFGDVLFKVSNWSTRTMSENCSKNKNEDARATSMTNFFVNCEHISHFDLIIVL